MDREAVFNRAEMMKRALESWRAAQGRDWESKVARKVADLRHYDVLAMDEIVAIYNWGRSGSVFLASLLDRHPDVVMLASLRSRGLYQFLDRYQSLPLREKLLTYPVFAEERGDPFFYGDFPVSETDYYAAIDALYTVYGDNSPDLLNSRRTFIQFIHVAYNLAWGRRPASTRPLIIYSQHGSDDAVVAKLVSDFPKARFLHTIRDPITSIGSALDRFIYISAGEGELPQPGYLAPATSTFTMLLNADCPNAGMDERTRAVRFEDMHLKPVETLRALTQWLGISEVPCPGESTFNGMPFVAESGASDWVGPRRDQAQRRHRNTWWLDRAQLYALLYENFVSWGYACPDFFRDAWLRRLVITMFMILPMKIEIAEARLIMRLQIEPALRQRKYGFAIRMVARLFRSLGYRRRMALSEIKRRIKGSEGVLDVPGGLARGQFRILHPVGAHSGEGADGSLLSARISRAAEDPDLLALVLMAAYSDSADNGAANIGELRKGMQIAPAAVARCIVRAATLLQTLVRNIRNHVFSAGKIHAADLPVMGLPGDAAGASGRAWIYVRDDRPFNGEAGPAAAVYFTPDRNSRYRFEHLRCFKGFLQTDSRAGFEPLNDITGAIIVEAASWANIRSRYTDIWEATGLREDRASPVLRQALERIGAIYAIDAEARCQPPLARVQVRSAARPLVFSFFTWIETELSKLDTSSPLAAAFRDTLARRNALSRFLDHGCLELDNRCVDPVLRGIRFSGRGWGLPGTAASGEQAAAIYTIIGSALLNNLSPYDYLRDLLGRLIDDESIPIEPVLPWNWIAA